MWEARVRTWRGRLTGVGRGCLDFRWVERQAHDEALAGGDSGGAQGRPAVVRRGTSRGAIFEEHRAERQSHEEALAGEATIEEHKARKF